MAKEEGFALMFLLASCVGRILVQRLLLALCAPLSRAKMGGRQPFPVPRNAYEQSLAPPGYKAPVARSQTASACVLAGVMNE